MTLVVGIRLMTKDRLLSWILQCDPIYVLCLTAAESVSHLFFQCNYSKQIWQRVLDLLSCRRNVQDFSHEVSLALKFCRKTKVAGRLFMMFFAEAVYAIWIQRNNTVFKGCCLPAETVFKDVVFRVACRCSNVDRKLLIM
ncbi:uncharacterized protein LOC110698404 [Chenopodium quinoa]|uniref:uncharacterized protein LOC110698404 n=1 Tax=Chenopodium quinoa TaxID=63459 RepID=UPI000B7936EB|nr:uncharacterized protein LOC110698404 [Chenopodium quinoa]